MLDICFVYVVCEDQVIACLLSLAGHPVNYSGTASVCVCVSPCVCVCVLIPVRQYGYAFQAFSWMLRAEAGANILTKDGTLLKEESVLGHGDMGEISYCCNIFLISRGRL